MLSKIWSYMPNKKKYRNNIMHKLQNNEVKLYFWGAYYLYCLQDAKWSPRFVLRIGIFMIAHQVLDENWPARFISPPT